MMSTVHESKSVNSWIGEVIKKLSFFVEYNKYTKGVARSCQYLSYLSVLRKTVKWSKKVLLSFWNCAVFIAFLCKNFVPKSKCRIQHIICLLQLSLVQAMFSIQQRNQCLQIPNKTIQIRCQGTETNIFFLISHFICNLYNNNTINKYFDK
jgi:hypothetical protein